MGTGQTSETPSRRTRDLPFDSLYRHGFVRAAVALPIVEVADPATNADRTLELARQAHSRSCQLAVFPELGLSGYAIDDLLHQEALLDGCQRALERIIIESSELRPVLLIGLPWRVSGRLFNCAAVVHRGRLLGVVPKSYLPNYREYYEKRHFTPEAGRTVDVISLGGHAAVPFGSHLLFFDPSVEGFQLHVEICEDLWAPLSPSSLGAVAGATLLCNLSASNVTIDKAAYRRLLCSSQSGKCVAAYLYAGAGHGESTTDLSWDGHGMIAENGELLAESRRFQNEPQLVCADIDLQRLLHERMRLSSFGDTVERERETVTRFRRVELELDLPSEPIELEREIGRFPYVPSNSEALDERCSEAYHIQVHGLTKRLQATGIERVVIGISGGLDSTHALIVSVKTMERLGLPRGNVLAYSMPGFATSAKTRGNANALMEALGVSGSEIDIRPSCEQMLGDLDHPYSRGEEVFDTTFENVQAGERTSHLFRLANLHRGLVVGTGDLSELALGWSTYGVGDQMSHYNVNASLPKTLIQHLIRWVADSQELGEQASSTLRSILSTEISPELVPGDPANGDPADGSPHQSTEAVIGPYELQDFHLYYLTRYGYLPSRVAYLCHHSWRDKSRGSWPASLGEQDHRQYDLEEIKHWLEVFIQRFFAFSQFKRSAMPNGPKVGSGGSLSPRGDWRAPSDASAAVWLEELKRNVP